MFDTLSTTCLALEMLAGEFEPRWLSGAESVRVVEELGVMRRLLDGMLGKAAMRVEETAAHKENGKSERDAAHLVSRALGSETSEARRAIATAKQLEELPDTDDAVRAGKLSARQAELVADAATVNPGAERRLLETAANEGMVRLREECIKARAEVEDEKKRAVRQHADRRLRMWTAKDGMVEGHFRLAPEVGGQLKTAIEARTQQIFRENWKSGGREQLGAYAADALTELVLGDGTKSSGVTTHVVIDHEALVRGNALPGEQCEIPGVGPVSVEWVREMLGESFITAIVKKGRDIATVAHFGRHIPAHLRTAMIVAGRECVIEGCESRGYLEIDHCDVDYAEGGPASWLNLGYGCSIHHDQKSRGWKLGPRNPRTGKRTLSPP